MNVVPPGTGICHQVNLESLAKVVWTENNEAGRRVPRHARRHRLAHHDDQRPGRVRLGRRRHRGGVGDARPADGDADPAGRRLRAHRHVAAGHDRDRPRAHGHADAAQEGCRRQVRRVLRRRARRAVAAGPRDDREHGARVRRDDGLLPGRRRDARVPALHRPPRRPGPARRALREGKSPVRARRRREPVFSDTLALDLGTVEPSLAGPERPQDRVPLEDCDDVVAAARSRTSSPSTALATASRVGRRRRRGAADAERRRDEVTAPRLGRDRGDHELHEHLEPVGADRGGPARAEGGRARPHARSRGSRRRSRPARRSSPITSRPPA